ncbi:MAG: RdgB/HAM1 family non-canonical purine NTP pyrophosphatase [Clostridiales bacterium]|jgi:XTP/dITP diphosphohydrolase|nr:RdgB/HAM1 family non-canonical purine NTP pyrophosphatase [Clostridiales bacterium]
MEIVFATKNKGKLVEAKRILSDFTIVGMEELNIDIDVVEDGETFEENALIKAREISKACGKVVMSDDSGIEIDFLDKKPGVHSARFLGHDTPYDIKNAKILDMMKDVEKKDRTARYVAAIALVFPEGREIVTTGYMEGRIGYEALGEGGFGYDPIFFVPEYNQTAAQMSAEFKNSISHRGKALRLMKEEMEKQLGV